MDRQEREYEGERIPPDEPENKERQACTAKNINLSKVIAMDLSGNKDIIMPSPAKIKDELIIQTRMQDYMDTVHQYMISKCDSRGMFKEGTNLTDIERAGLDEIKEGIQTKNWMIYTSDKIGKVVLDTKDNFLELLRRG